MASFLGIPWTKSSLERNQESVELYPKQVDTSWFKSRTLPHKGPLQPPKVLAVLFSTFEFLFASLSVLSRVSGSPE